MKVVLVYNIYEMEKLMELLRKYEIERRKNSCLIKKIPYGNNNDIKKNRFLIISKEYGFIKWLVDNDKIDTKKVEIRPFSDKLVYSDSDCTVYRSDTTYEMLLMLLAIQDSPIEYLISILR